MRNLKARVAHDYPAMHQRILALSQSLAYFPAPPTGHGSGQLILFHLEKHLLGSVLVARHLEACFTYTQ